MNVPSVSVVIPVQHPDHDALAETFAALARQTVRPAEVILVDASRDSNPAALRRLTDLPVRVIDFPPAARNTLIEQRRRGIQAATGTYILELDEDAVIKRDDHIEQQVATLEANPDAVAVGGRAVPSETTLSGRAAAATIRHLPNAYSMFQLFRRSTCPDGFGCYPDPETLDEPLATYVWVSEGNDDVVRQHQLSTHGCIIRDNDLVTETELPTHRQRAIRNVGVGLIAGGVAGALIGVVT